MTAQPVLLTRRLVLRPFERDDAPSVQRLAGAAEVADTTLSIPHPYPDGMAEEWIATHRPAWDAGAWATFAVTVPTGELVGAVGLRLEAAHRRAELGYWIGVPWWGQGLATEAAAAVVGFGLDDLALNRVYAAHLTRNPASGRVLQKIGMRFEGVQREHFLKNGRFEDVARYAILRGDDHPPGPRRAGPETAS